MNKILIIVFLLVSNPASAQPSVFDPTHVEWNNTHAAEVLSNIGVATGIGLDVVDVIRNNNKKHASWILAKRYAVILVITETTKRLVHRTRPDMSDNKSWPSEHTAFASGRWYVGIPVGYLRMGANKHYLTDVGSGYAVRKTVNHFIK